MIVVEMSLIFPPIVGKRVERICREGCDKFYLFSKHRWGQWSKEGTICGIDVDEMRVMRVMRENRVVVFTNHNVEDIKSIGSTIGPIGIQTSLRDVTNQESQRWESWQCKRRTCKVKHFRRDEQMRALV